MIASAPADDPLRCPWPKDDALYVAYHDEEWGVPEFDDRALYEKLVLDGFQAGLSWITILRKRENFRRAFDGFVPEKIARYRPNKIERLMQNAGIVRNRAKIEGTVRSARQSRPASAKSAPWDRRPAGAGLPSFASTGSLTRCRAVSGSLPAAFRSG